jgi:hypothetical protein
MKILLIVEPERTDWYYYFESDTSNEYVLLWYESRSDIPPFVKEKSFFKEVYYWSAFISPDELLRKIKPDRIVFFEILDQRQIALLVAANKKAVKTFYLDHGAAGNKEFAIKRANQKNYFRKKKMGYLLRRLKGASWLMLKSKLFYYSALPHLSSLGSVLRYFRLPFSMLFSPPNKALRNCIFVERMPYRFIVFNKPNFEQTQVYTGAPEEKAIFTGIPFFDSYYSYRNSPGNHVSYIDHPYLEEKLLGWTPEYHRKIAKHLFDFSKSKRIKVLVKLHPRSDLSLWHSYGFDSPFFQVVQFGDLTKQLLESKLILAYSSSMVNGFLCAKKNVVLLGWHPEPGIFGADFSKTGLCHFSPSPDELEPKFDYFVSNNLSLTNEASYQEFLKEFNHPFDGKATERVIEAIVGHEGH